MLQELEDNLSAWRESLRSKATNELEGNALRLMQLDVEDRWQG